nr:MAG TPA: hypothetical protein [Inoviridae sp.]
MTGTGGTVLQSFCQCVKRPSPPACWPSDIAASHTTMRKRKNLAPFSG